MKIVMAYFEALAGISGGLERILCNFSNEMAARGHQVWVIYNDGSSGAPFYPLKKEVQMINLRSMTTVKSQLTVAEKIYREWCRLLRGKKGVHEWKAKCRNGYIARLFPGVMDKIHPDVIVSYNHETSGQLLYAGIKDIPLITMFHNDPDVLCAGMTDMERKGIAHSDLIQVLTPDQKKKAIKYFPKDRVICIPNEVPQISRGRGGVKIKGTSVLSMWHG